MQLVGKSQQKKLETTPLVDGDWAVEVTNCIFSRQGILCFLILKPRAAFSFFPSTHINKCGVFFLFPIYVIVNILLHQFFTFVTTKHMDTNWTRSGLLRPRAQKEKLVDADILSQLYELTKTLSIIKTFFLYAIGVSPTVPQNQVPPEYRNKKKTRQKIYSTV